MALSSSLEKAYLTIMQPDSATGGSEIDQIRFQFNPKEYTIQKSVSWKTNQARSPNDAPTAEFQGSEPASMSLEMFLDASEAPSEPITNNIKLLFDCVTPTEETVFRNRPQPPIVLFGWGRATPLRAVVKQVQVKYTMFNPDGTPIRAVCTVQLQEVSKTLPKQNPTSGSLTSQRSHIVCPGDSLASISHQEYGTPTFWRALAVANGIDDPMRLSEGSTVLVPSEAEAAEFA